MDLRKKLQKVGEHFILSSRKVCNLQQIIIRLVESMRMRWPGRVARMERLEMLAKYWVGSLLEGDNIEDVGVLCTITIRFILLKVC